MSRIYYWDELEKISIEENSNRYRRVKRALFGDPTGKIKTFAIISPENPLGLEDTTEEEWKEKFRKWTSDPRRYNKEALASMKQELLADRIEKTGDDAMRYGGFNYVQIKGRYGKNERTFIIFNISLSDAKVIARDYGQLSFFWGIVANTEDTPSTIGYYMTKNACATYDLIEVSNTIYDAKDAEDLFSKYGFKYKIAMREFSDSVPEVTDTKAFEESMNEIGTFMHRAIHRRDAYKKKSTPIEENKSTRLKSALFDRTHRVRSFAILTAENPGGEQLTPQENAERRKELKKDLNSFRLPYIKIRGRYKSSKDDNQLDENSVLITNLTLGEATYLADKYGQESFFYGDENGISYYEVGDDGKYHNIETTKQVDTIQDADNFFSRFRNFKFSVYLDYFNEPDTEVSADVADELDKSLEESRTLKSRIIHRKRVETKSKK